MGSEENEDLYAYAYLFFFFFGVAGEGVGGVVYETKILALLLDPDYNFNFVLMVSHVARKITSNWIITKILMYGTVCFFVPIK